MEWSGGREGGFKEGATKKLTVSAGTVHRESGPTTRLRVHLFYFFLLFFLHQDDRKCTEKNNMEVCEVGGGGCYKYGS